MMKLKIILFCILFSQCNIVISQSSGQRLHIGDSVPDLIMKNILNHPTGEVHLSDYQDQLFLLDFMATFCGPCIKHLSRLDSLQQQINGFSILPITRESTDRVSKFLKKKNWAMPFGVEGDEILYEMFPHTIISHLIWIRNKKIVAITGTEQATTNNITAILNGDNLFLPEKNDLITYDRNKPLLVNGNGGNGDNLMFQSVFTGYIPGIPGGYKKSKDGLKSVNTSVLELYKRIFSHSSPDNYFLSFNNRISLEINDSLLTIINDNIKAANLFCYNLFVPEGVPRQHMFNYAKEDLNRFFGIHYGIEGTIAKREIKCLVLIKAGSDSLIDSKGGEILRKWDELGNLILQNQPISTLHRILSYQLKDLPTPVIDMTGYTGTMDILLTGDLDDLDNIRQVLNRYGLDLSEMLCEVDMLVISEKNKKLTDQL